MSDAPEHDQLDRLFSEIREIVQRARDERARFGHIAATIRVNALHHGATTEEAEAMVNGELNFITWLAAKVETPAPSGAAVMAHPKVQALVEALQHCLSTITCGMDGIWDHTSTRPADMARAALAAWDALTGEAK